MDVYLVSALSGFVGVVIGGLITFLTARWIETQKWQQQKKDRLLQEQREALKLVMNGLTPLANAIEEASIMAIKGRRPGIRGSDLSVDAWPDLNDLLQKIEIADTSWLLLPDGISLDRVLLVAKIDTVRRLSTRLNTKIQTQKAKHADSPQVDWSEIGKMQAELEDEIKELGLAKDKFYREVWDAYRETYN